MKKVLIISNLFHSSPRIPGIAFWLSDFGWEPVIMSVPIVNDPKKLLAFPAGFKEKIRIVEVSYKGDIFSGLRKFLVKAGFKEEASILNQAEEKAGFFKKIILFAFKFYRTIIAYPDEEKKWIKPAFNIAMDILEKEDFSAIISSSSPVSTHIICHKIKEKKLIKWLADFRDLWTGNHEYPYFEWRKFFEKGFEIKTLASADYLVTVSAPFAQKLNALHKKKECLVVPNGFDPEKINNGSILTKRFTITYTGQTYNGKQDSLKLIVSLREMIDDKEIDENDLEVRFYGPRNFELEKQIKKNQLSKIIRQYGKISYEESIKKQDESQILLLLNWEGGYKGVYPGKVFQYLAAKRPILATGGVKGDVVSELLDETEAGINAISIEEIKKVIKKYYIEYKANGKVEYKGDKGEILKYSYKDQARKVASILNEINL